MLGTYMVYQSLLKPLLFQLDAEKAHDAACKIARKTGQSKLLQSLAEKLYNFQSPLLEQHFWGISFRNPIGLAAGFDKNGCLLQGFQSLGLGYVEVGSVTAQAHCGNPKPRAFRLPQDRALINRMGLNNDGAQTITKRLQNTDCSIAVGVNIAKTHDTHIAGAEAIEDYLFSYSEALKVADYITVNISCPNTAAGKTFEEPHSLDQLLLALLDKPQIDPVPTLVKFSSDLSQPQVRQLVEVCETHRVDGYVACNTSSARRNLATDEETLRSIGKGGLSGAPLASKSIRTIQWIRTLIGTEKPIIGVGGIDSFETALKMLQAGANLLQLYTGLIYEGPGLVKDINQKLATYMQAHGFSSIHKL